MNGYPLPVEFRRDSCDGVGTVWKAWRLGVINGPTERLGVCLGYRYEKNELLAIFPHAFMRDGYGDLRPVLR